MDGSNELGDRETPRMFAPSLRQAVEDDLPVVWLWSLSEEDGVRGEGEDEAGVCVAGGYAGGA